MTREHAKALLPIITAFANGEPIEFQTETECGTWVPIKEPSFSCPPCAYRIKPKPRDLWFNIYSNEPLSPMVMGPGYLTKRDAQEAGSSFQLLGGARNLGVIHLREVLD